MSVQCCASEPGLFAQSYAVACLVPGIADIQHQRTAVAAPDLRAGKIPGIGLIRSCQCAAGGSEIPPAAIAEGDAGTAVEQRVGIVCFDSQPALRRGFCLHRALPHELRGQRFVAVLARLRERGKRDARGVAAREAARCTVFPVRQTKKVAEGVGLVPLEVSLRGVAQRAQDKCQVLVGCYLVVAAEALCAQAVGEAVCIGVADIGPCPVGKVGKRNRPSAGLGLHFLAEQTHEHGHGLRARRRGVETVDGLAVRRFTGALKKAKLIERVGRFLGAVVCGERRGGKRKHDEKCEKGTQ